MATKTVSNRTAAGPQIKTKLPGPNAARTVKLDDKFISPSYTRSYPMVAKRGRGCIVEDVDGNEFLDFAAGIAVCSTGHCHPEVVAAIQKQAAELIHISGTDFYYENMVTLADRLSKVAPMKGPHRFYFGNSGAEAIEAALTRNLATGPVDDVTPGAPTRWFIRAYLEPSEQTKRATAPSKIRPSAEVEPTTLDDLIANMEKEELVPATLA